MSSEEIYLIGIDKNFILEIYSQKHKEIITKYQIMTTSILSFSLGFAIAYATKQIHTKNPFNMVAFSLGYGILGFFGLTVIFENYFKSIKQQLLDIGD